MITASIDIDAQNCFTPVCPNELPIPGGSDIVEALNQQAKLTNFRIGTKDAHPANAIWVADDEHPQLTPIVGDNVDYYWNTHAVPGTKGFELISGLPHPTDYDFFVWKGIEADLHPYGCCYHDMHNQLSTGLIEFLHSKQVSSVIVGGLALEYCVKISVLQLLNAGFNVVVNLDACRGVSQQTIDIAKREMQTAGAIIIDMVSSLIETSIKI